MVEVYTEIYNKVGKYGQRHKDNEETTEQEEKFSPLDHSFIKWMNKMKENESIIRMYSLNYDDMFKDVLEKQNGANWNIHDEFESEAKNPFGRALDLNNL